MTYCNVVHLTDCSSGGVPAVISELVRNINGKIIFLNGKPKQYDDEYIISDDLKLPRTLNPFKVLINYIKIYKIVKKLKPQIIHAHSAFGGVYGSMLSMHLKLPLIYTPHATPAMISKSSIKMRIIGQFEKITTRCARKIIACSFDEAEVLRRITRNKQKIEIIANCVLPLYEGVRNFEIDIVSVGRISDQKRPDLFIRISEQLKLKFPDIRIGWIGPGNHIENNAGIVWYSEVPEKKVEYLLNRTKIFLSTSDYEGLSLAALKASVAGCYLVLRNTVGTRAPIKFGASGKLFDSEVDAVEIVTELINSKVLDDVDSRSKIAKSNAEIFLLDKQIVDHKTLYNSLIANES
jgi:glycosyltransferase involved in cell wall biosynthesis